MEEDWVCGRGLGLWSRIRLVIKDYVCDRGSTH